MAPLAAPLVERADGEHSIDEGGERAEFGRLARWGGVELYRASLRRHAFDAHAHEGYGIGVIEAGAERFEYRGAGWRAPAGSLVLMEPDAIHTGRADGDAGWRYRMAYVDRGTLAALCGGAPPRFDEPVARDPARAARLAAALRAAWSASGTGTEALAAESALAAALIDVAVAHGRGAPAGDDRGPGPADARWRRLVDWIDANVGAPIALQDLAGIAGVGRFHLVRSLRAGFGVTPMALVHARRLVAARRALARGTPPAEAAAAAGFADQSHLTRSLLRTHGVTPAQYQRQLGSRPARAPRRSSTDEGRPALPDRPPLRARGPAHG